MVTTIRGLSNKFQTKGDFGLGTTEFSNALVGFPSCKKSKVIYEGMTTRDYQGVLGNAWKY